MQILTQGWLTFTIDNVVLDHSSLTLEESISFFFFFVFLEKLMKAFKSHSRINAKEKKLCALCKVYCPLCKRAGPGTTGCEYYRPLPSSTMLWSVWWEHVISFQYKSLSIKKINFYLQWVHVHTPQAFPLNSPKAPGILQPKALSEGTLTTDSIVHEHSCTPLSSGTWLFSSWYWFGILSLHFIIPFPRFFSCWSCHCCLLCIYF